MPMVGHIAETGQVVAVDFRQGNVPPAQDNLAFIQQCQQSLPEGCALNALRIDAAGYQTKIIEYCDTQGIEYAIRAKTSAAMRAQSEAASDSDWLPLLDKQGEVMGGQDTYRTSFCIGDYEKAFTLIIQRTALKGQASLDLDSQESSGAISQGGYIYRAIATNRGGLSDSQIVHWYKVNWCVAPREGALGYKVNWCVALREGALGYNQRAEDSENRLKELKLDFGGDTLPCPDFNANALYFLISALSYNLFALMRQLLPEELAHHRAMTLRWRLYAIAAKVVRTGRQLFVKLKESHRKLLEQVLVALKEFEPPPI